MSFSYFETDIGDSSTDYISFVRFQLDDTNSSAYDLSDEVITALYNETSADDYVGSDAYIQINRNYQTAIKAAESLYRKYSKLPSFSADGVSIQYKDRADMWLNIVNTLRATWSTITGYSNIIYASRPASYWE